MQQPVIRHGSSKDVIIPGPAAKEICLLFTQRFSVFDVGPVPYLIEDMDLLRHAIAARGFEVLAENDVPTHFMRADRDALTITVEPFNIYEMKQHFESARGRIVPLEIIDRQELTQAVIDRAESNDELREKIRARVPGELISGTPFSSPLVECTTKYEAIDRRLLDAEAIKLARLGADSYADLTTFVNMASDVLTCFFQDHGFTRLDGKWEVAITYDGPSFVVVDSYSPDEMRLIGKDGRSYDKDPLRNWYKETFPEWICELEAAKKQWPTDKKRWPSYPPDVPPDSVLDDLRDRYAAVAKAIGAI